MAKYWNVDELVTLVVVDFEHTVPKPKPLDYNELIKTCSPTKAMNRIRDNEALITSWERFVLEEAKLIEELGNFASLCVSIGHLTTLSITPDFSKSEVTKELLTNDMSNKRRKEFRKAAKLTAQFMFDNTPSKYSKFNWFMPYGAHVLQRVLMQGHCSVNDLIDMNCDDPYVLSKLAKKLHAYIEVEMNNLEGMPKRQRVVYAADGKRKLKEEDTLTVNGEEIVHSNPDFSKVTLADVVVDDIDRYKMEKDFNLF